MSNCKFVNIFNRLSKSSIDSIDNVEDFDDFKEYMHVERQVENDLKDVLRKVNASGKKTLVLLCGSAGDGKSHLLSYLKNADEEKLIQDYVICNDATESSFPSMTAIETLSYSLDRFKDVNLDQPGENIILAINLGVLSNFVESEYASEFENLKKYVKDCNILTSQVNGNTFKPDSCFQYVSFSDYHMYGLKEDGVHAEYIEKIFKKIFGKREENIFFKAYQEECSSCPLSQKCPVKRNYEYMTVDNRQKYVSELLVKTIIQDKFILTTREILNFIYNIIVSQNFSYSKFQKLLIDDTAYLKEFLKQITPALLFDSTDFTVLLTKLQKYDPLLNRSETADTEAILYYVSVDISKDLSKAFDGTAYKDIICSSTLKGKINEDEAIKANLFNIIVRVKEIENNDSIDEIYNQYLSNLYFFNAGKVRKLDALYRQIERAVTQWCGSDKNGNLCLNSGNEKFVLYESVEFEPVLNDLPSSEDAEELKRFTPSIRVAVKGYDGKKIVLDIDYTLYEVIYKLNKGYIQTASDRNNHADFIGFVNKILQNGSHTKKLEIVSREGKRASISKTEFGYRFEVVK